MSPMHEIQIKHLDFNFISIFERTRSYNSQFFFLEKLLFILCSKIHRPTQNSTSLKIIIFSMVYREATKHKNDLELLQK